MQALSTLRTFSKHGHFGFFSGGWQVRVSVCVKISSIRNTFSAQLFYCFAFISEASTQIQTQGSICLCTSIYQFCVPCKTDIISVTFRDHLKKPLSGDDVTFTTCSYECVTETKVHME